MKKTLLLMVAGLMLLTQCRKDDLAGVTPGTQTVNMTVTVGTGRTNIGDSGSITWSENDKLYVSDGTECIGCLTLKGKGESSTGTFEGLVKNTNESGTSTYHFFYLGNGGNVTFNGKTSENYENATLATIDFNSQSGVLGGLGQYHIGYGTEIGTLTTTGDTKTITIKETVKMSSKVAIAYFEFKDGTEGGYNDKVTISGAYNQMNVNFKCASTTVDEIFKGSANGEIVLSSDGKASSQRYVMLVPQKETTQREGVTLTFSKNSTSSKGDPTVEFTKGIEANHFYCKDGNFNDPIEVTFPKTNQ